MHSDFWEVETFLLQNNSKQKIRLMYLRLYNIKWRPIHRPFSKMAAKNSNTLKLAKIKNVCQHQKEHLYFSTPATFQHFRCNIS